MNLKTISKLLISSMLVSNLNVLSFASSWSEDGRYETFNESNIVIDDILEEDKVNIGIEGNTLVNLLNGTIRHNETDVKCSDLVRISSLTNGRRIASFFPDRDIGFGNTYTIVLDIENKNYAQLSSYVWYEDGTLEYNTFPFYSKGKGVAKSFKTQDKKVSSLALYLADYTESERYFEIKNVMLFDGDESSNPPQEYFEGMKSSFEENIVTQDMVNNDLEEAKNLGKYKVKIKSSGKNKVDPTNARNSYRLDCDIENDVITLTQNTYDYFGYYAIKLNLKPNTRYVFQGSASGGNNSKMRLYSFETGTDYGFVCNGTVVQTKDDVNSVCLLLYLCFNELTDVGVTATFSNIQLEEGSTATEYEPYRESIKTFYLNSPLLEGDTIEYVNRKATHIKRGKEIILDGSDDENWAYNHSGGGYYTYYTRLSNFDSRLEPIIISDNFLYVGGASTIFAHSQGFKVHPNYSNVLYLCINELTSVTEVKQWLQNNPTTVVYELAEPIYEPIDANLSIDLNLGTTHITNNSTIPANMKITVDRVANRAQEAVELAKTTPTVENLSQARYWTNLLKESTLKDSFQEQVDNILEVEDLTIEKKTTSVNADVYIKMKNTLSLSLDTNSIVFDEVDATEDTEMQNAVNLTISSSLPYRVNAYLEDEIYNADKSETLDKSILNIRANGKSLYQAFADLSSSIMLLDDQEAGVDNIHGIDLRLASNDTNKADIYKTVIKFEVEQK